MTSTRSTTARKRRLVVGGAVLAALAIGGLTIGANLAGMPPATKAAAAARPGDAGGLQDPVADSSPTSTGKVTATRVRIPAIHVDTRLIGLDLKPGTDQLKAPLDFSVAGWYVDGTVPGDIGPAVIDGHVDSPTAPGVFLHLAKLKAGDRILVTLSTKEVKTFVVTKKVAAPKAHFPTQAVYGPVPTPQLRVITCDGYFDKSTGHYRDNLVVFADLLS